MFGKLQGVVEYCGAGFVILTTGGVGYKVMLPGNILATQRVGADAAFWIETVVREDAINLIGFDSIAAQELFVKLTGVSGIGTKLALAILGVFKVPVLGSAIVSGDVKTLCGVPGVGKKVAERIIVELKGKVAGSAVDSASGDVYNDTLAALESLGYRRADCVESVQRLVKDNPGDAVEALITKALKEYAAK